jgi:hypothetical protein
MSKITGQLILTDRGRALMIACRRSQNIKKVIPGHENWRKEMAKALKAARIRAGKR